MNKILSFAQKGVILNRSRDSLLVSKYLTSKYLPDKLVNKYCLPGGQLEFGQEPDQSFIEEVQSETGITIIPGTPFYIWSWKYKKQDAEKQIVAAARVGYFSKGKIKPPPIEKETTIDIARWMSLKQLKKLINQFVIDEQPVLRRFLKLKYSAHNCELFLKR